MTRLKAWALNRVAAFVLSTLVVLATALTPVYGLADVSGLAGIHYAPPRNILHPDVWKQEILHTYDCENPCSLEFDGRLSAVHLRYKWGQLNPAPGVYDFEALGGAIDLVASKGAKVTLIVMAGKYTPSWVFEQGARSLPIQFRYSESEDYSQPNMPLPWDGTFLNAYEDMVAALSDYLHQTPSRYEAVILVKNGAVVANSGETRLMPLIAFFKGSEFSNGNKREKRAELCRAWASVNYREDKITAAMRRTNAALDEAFPDKLLGMAFVHGSARFPTVSDSTGECLERGYNETLEKLIKEMVVVYRSRAVLNSTTLFADGGEPEILRWARANGGKIGFQLNREEVGCREDSPDACDTGDVRDSLMKGIEQGALFIEVHNGNIHRHRQTLKEFDTILKHSGN